MARYVASVMGSASMAALIVFSVDHMSSLRGVNEEQTRHRRLAKYADGPMRGIAYGPLPCKGPCRVSEDMLQEGYMPLWAPPPHRDDLGVIKRLGANTVRLYHSIGLDGRGEHGSFLDYAHLAGLDVMPGYHTYNAVYGGCPEWDCFQTWKDYTLKALLQGFRQGDDWHSAVSMLILFNEPDFFRGYGRKAPIKAAVSAFEGVLAAEQEAGVGPGRVKISIAWSNSPDKSLDNTTEGLAIWAWQDVESCIANPSLAGYTRHEPSIDMVAAYNSRWAHGINVQTPGIVEYMNDHYKGSQPWFIGEYGANGFSKEGIEKELLYMDKMATDPTNPFMGMSFFQFQTAYFKGGSEMNFGLFRLGDTELNMTGDICDKGNGCSQFPVYCLTTSKGSLPDIVEHRADAVATAWGGKIDPHDMC